MSDAVDAGITVTEIAPLDRPIDAAPETTAVFVGRALRGPLDTPVRVRNFGEFRRRFGDSWSHSSLGPAVRQFFDHGGARLWVVRVASNAQGARLCLPANGSALLLRAVEPGSSECIRAAVDYDGIAQDDDCFNLTLQRLDPGRGIVADQESYTSVSCDPESPSFVGDALEQSGIARVEEPFPARRPELTLAGDSRYAPGWIDRPYQKGTDGTEISDYDLVGSRAGQTGIFSLDAVDRFDLLYLPPRGRSLDTGPAAIMAAERYCHRRNAMLIVDPPAHCASAGAAVAAVIESGYGSPNMLSYFPRVRTSNEPGAGVRTIGGALAGLLCRADSRYGRWVDFSVDNARLARGITPAVDVDAHDRQALARAGFNILERTVGGRCVVTGSRTMARGTDLNGFFTRLPVRRLCLQIINAIDLATRWTVFQRTDQELADTLCQQVRAYLARLLELGALCDGRYTVRCEAGIPLSDRGARGNGATLLLTFHPTGSASPVSLTLHQDASGLRVANTAFAPAGVD